MATAIENTPATLDELEKAIDIDLVDDAPSTEGGNASRLIAIHGNDMRYCHTYQAWYVWNGQYWAQDEDGAVKRFAEDVVKYLYHLAQNASSQAERASITKNAFCADRSSSLNNILEIAKHREGITCTWRDLDSDPWLLGAGDMTIDLRTCTARPSRRKDMITRQIGTIYDPAAQCPRWRQFIGEVFPDRPDMQKYVQRSVGYSLTDEMIEEVFFFLLGKGSNGKSVFLETILKLMGAYGKNAAFDTFLVQKNQKIRTDLAALHGARFITANEAPEGSEFDMTVIKAWASGNKITARFLYGKEFEFNATGKLWLAANYKPRITGRNYADWRRLHLIPFTATFKGEKKDKQLQKKLQAELPGILNWALEGLKEFQRIGLEPPKEVTDAVEQYREENDSLGAFISECCDTSSTILACRNKDLYGAYQQFCIETGHKVLLQTNFTSGLLNEGYTKDRDKQGMVWHGLALKAGVG